MQQRCFIVVGEPKAKGRPRATVAGGHARIYTPAVTRSWESILRGEAARNFDKPIAADRPVQLRVRFWFGLAKSRHRKRKPTPSTPHLSRPDLDNCIKLVKDALNGVCWVDDSQIVAVDAWKARCGQLDNRPRTEIVIEWEDGDG